MSEAGLPAGWEVRHSTSKKLPYFFNAATKESRWEYPANTDTEKLRAFMEQNYITPLGTQAGGRGERDGKIRAAHLLVKHRDSRRPGSWRETVITRTKEEAIAILEGYEKRIRNGEISLGDLASTESDCTSARKRGDLGYFGPGEMQKEFEVVAFALKIGEVSKVVETASGVHIIERLE